MIGALALFLAAIVSDDAKMFISGGEWLPDEVPNRAYYDAADPAGKELRLTTNVAAAVASCYSGICERGVIGTESGTGWWEQFGPDKLGMETFKTNVLWLGTFNEGDCWLNNPSNRQINSRRVLSYGQIDRLRDVLMDFANGYWNDRFDYGYDFWNGIPWGSSKLRGDGFPTWEWDSRSPAVIVTDWTRIWPQFTSCPNDGVWRTSTHSMHGALDGPLYFFDFGPFDDLYDLRESIKTNAIPDSCYRILEDRLGTNAVQFAADTLRLSYYRLGAIETAIAAMDTTYYTDLYPFYINYFLHERRSYFHQKGYENAQTPAVTVDWTRGTAEISGDPSWRSYEKWSTSTNDLQSYRHPAFVCSGDTPTGHQIASGSAGIILTWNTLTALGLQPGDFVMLTPNIVPGGQIEFEIFDLHTQADSFSTLPIELGAWSINMSAGITRTISVGYSSMLATDTVERVDYPTPWAWARGMVSNDVTALEYRVVCTNALPNTDNAGYVFGWVGDGRGEFAQTRSSHLGNYISTNSYLQGWRTERLRHRSAVSNMLSDFLGCSLTDRDTLIPIPAAAASAMRDNFPQNLAGPINASLEVTGIYLSMSPDGSSCTLDIYTAEDYYTTSLSPGGELTIGALTFSAVDDTNIDVSLYLRGRPPCSSYGEIAPACRIHWTFRNLHEE